VSNGVGPAWAPAGLRQALTWVSGFFFNSASWARHDEGYAAGGDAARRAYCDLQFLQAMLGDAAELPAPWRMAIGCVLAWIFWLAVRAFGWAAFRFTADVAR